MKRTLIIGLALLSAVMSPAAEKILEASAKHMPGWMGGMEEEYIITSSEGATLDEAQQKAMIRVREQIISAVATRVHSATSISIREVTDNGSIQSHREMTSDLSVEAADIPYLANVSPSHAADFYWTKIRRPDRSVYYTYNIKYPLPNSQLRSMVEEYEAQQKIINDSLQAFASDDMANYDDLEQMLMRHSQLKQFASGLRENDSRRDICQLIRSSYERMLNQNLHVQVFDYNRRVTRVALFYGNKHISCSLVPKAKSNCLTAIQIQNKGDLTEVSYDYQTGCYDDEQNWIEVSYVVLGKKILTRVYIK